MKLYNSIFPIKKPTRKQAINFNDDDDHLAHEHDRVQSLRQ